MNRAHYIKTKSGDEEDAFFARRVVRTEQKLLRKLKRKYNKRVRKDGKDFIRRQTEDD